ncbi:Uncharacterised protein [Enterobacter cancerogenus]|uniref:Uncharacterized protein n=1 Tax=Enterobacter cancerogenus TaxID=69218 RepID=A0A484XVT5_9ENTR|nr:Uncharacterised protein [Enterobacter cancerogenus]
MRTGRHSMNYSFDIAMSCCFIFPCRIMQQGNMFITDT